jgi:2-polyprenyl-3-methyl-5-hydroxy-6-metoxy-1,4-benzoquinol methylase
MELAGQKVDVVDLDREPLPYPDDTFDLITFTEVIEHVENHRAVLRDIQRVLKSGGLVLITTPNILNLKSRLRFLFFGFWNLFGPLHVSASDKYSTGGHINPISYFYLCHSLHDAGLEPVHTGIDKIQRISIPAMILLWLPIALLSRRALAREERKYKTVDESNKPIVKEMNRWRMLLGRTIVVAARKP